MHILPPVLIYVKVHVISFLKANKIIGTIWLWNNYSPGRTFRSKEVFQSTSLRFEPHKHLLLFQRPWEYEDACEDTSLYSTWKRGNKKWPPRSLVREKLTKRWQKDSALWVVGARINRICREKVDFLLCMRLNLVFQVWNLNQEKKRSKSVKRGYLLFWLRTFGEVGKESWDQTWEK